MNKAQPTRCLIQSQTPENNWETLQVIDRSSVPQGVGFREYVMKCWHQAQNEHAISLSQYGLGIRVVEE